MQSIFVKPTKLGGYKNGGKLISEWKEGISDPCLSAEALRHTSLDELTPL